MTKKRWRIVATIFLYGGAVAIACMFIAEISLTTYYHATRPLTPNPAQGWTEPLSWTYPGRYGTPQEESRQLLLFELQPLGFGLIVVGWAIRVHKLGVDPLTYLRHFPKQGP